MEQKIQNPEHKRNSIRTIPYSVFLIPHSHKRGVATLPTVLVLGVMILAVAVAITTVSLSESFISQGGAQSAKALFYAEVGARDALIKIARNKGYSCATTDCYNIDFTTNGCSLGNDCAMVQVSTADGSTATPKIITSKGTMKASSRTIQVTVLLDSGTPGDGRITSSTWIELTN